MKTFKEFLLILNEAVSFPELVKAQREATKELFSSLDKINTSMENIVRQGFMKDSAIFTDFIDIRHKISKWNTELIDNNLLKKK